MRSVFRVEVNLPPMVENLPPMEVNLPPLQNFKCLGELTGSRWTRRAQTCIPYHQLDCQLSEACMRSGPRVEVILPPMEVNLPPLLNVKCLGELTC